MVRWLTVGLNGDVVVVVLYDSRQMREGLSKRVRKGERWIEERWRGREKLLKREGGEEREEMREESGWWLKHEKKQTPTDIYDKLGLYFLNL